MPLAFIQDQRLLAAGGGIGELNSGFKLSFPRPVVVTFEEFKDREEILRKANMLKGSNIHVTEDMSR